MSTVAEVWLIGGVVSAVYALFQIYNVLLAILRAIE